MSFPCSVRLISSGSSASLSTSESFSMLFACRFKIFSFGYCSKTYKQRKTNLLYYYTLDQLWKLWLILSILSIYKRVCRDNPIPAVDIELSCRVQTLPSFQAPCPCNVLKLLQAQREESSFAYCLKKWMILNLAPYHAQVTRLKVLGVVAPLFVLISVFWCPVNRVKSSNWHEANRFAN